MIGRHTLLALRGQAYAPQDLNWVSIKELFVPDTTKLSLPVSVTDSAISGHMPRRRGPHSDNLGPAFTLTASVFIGLLKATDSSYHEIEAETPVDILESP